MSTFETKQLDNFVFDELVDPREQTSVKTPFLRKNIVYQVDSQNGNGDYSNPDVIIDTQSIASSGNLLNWRDAYIAAPLRTYFSVTLDGSGTSGGPTVDEAHSVLGLKNMSFLHSLKVEANGKVIISANEGLEQLVNVKALCTWNTEMVKKNGATVFFSPDSAGSLGYADTYLNNNVGNDVTEASTGQSVGPTPYNTGLMDRQQALLPKKTLKVLSSAQAKEEGYAYDSATSALAFATTTEQILSDIHYVAIIRLRDICDLFDKHPLSRGVSYRFTLRFNQATTSWKTGSTAYCGLPSAENAISTVCQTGTVQPAVACIGANTIFESGTPLGGSVDKTIKIVHKIDANNANARFNGVRVYVESFEPSPEALEEILAKEPIERWFNDYLYTSTPTSVSADAMSTMQLSTSCTNPRALILVPRVATGTTVDTTTYNGMPNTQNPFCMAPGSTDGFLSLTNVQVKVGSSYVLPDRVYFSYQAFLDNARSVFSVDGGDSTFQTGLIDKKMFETNHRYYIFDLSRFPESMTDLPQMISVEFKNNTTQKIEIDALTVYGRRAEWNNAQGSMTITA